MATQSGQVSQVSSSAPALEIQGEEVKASGSALFQSIDLGNLNLADSAVLPTAKKVEDVKIGAAREAEITKLQANVQRLRGKATAFSFKDKLYYLFLPIANLFRTLTPEQEKQRDLYEQCMKVKDAASKVKDRQEDLVNKERMSGELFNDIKTNLLPEQIAQQPEMQQVFAKDADVRSKTEELISEGQKFMEQVRAFGTSEEQTALIEAGLSLLEQEIPGSNVRAMLTDPSYICASMARESLQSTAGMSGFINNFAGMYYSSIERASMAPDVSKEEIAEQAGVELVDAAADVAGSEAALLSYLVELNNGLKTVSQPGSAFVQSLKVTEATEFFDESIKELVKGDQEITMKTLEGIRHQGISVAAVVGKDANDLAVELESIRSGNKGLDVLEGERIELERKLEKFQTERAKLDDSLSEHRPVAFGVLTEFLGISAENFVNYDQLKQTICHGEEMAELHKFATAANNLYLTILKLKGLSEMAAATQKTDPTLVQLGVELETLKRDETSLGKKFEAQLAEKTEVIKTAAAAQLEKAALTGHFNNQKGDLDRARSSDNEKSLRAVLREMAATDRELVAQEEVIAEREADLEERKKTLEKTKGELMEAQQEITAKQSKKAVRESTLKKEHQARIAPVMETCDGIRNTIFNFTNKELLAMSGAAAPEGNLQTFRRKEAVTAAAQLRELDTVLIPEINKKLETGQEEHAKLVEKQIERTEHAESSLKANDLLSKGFIRESVLLRRSVAFNIAQAIIIKNRENEALLAKLGQRTRMDPLDLFLLLDTSGEKVDMDTWKTSKRKAIARKFEKPFGRLDASLEAETGEKPKPASFSTSDTSDKWFDISDRLGVPSASKEPMVLSYKQLEAEEKAK